MTRWFLILGIVLIGLDSHARDRVCAHKCAHICALTSVRGLRVVIRELVVTQARWRSCSMSGGLGCEMMLLVRREKR